MKDIPKQILNITSKIEYDNSTNDENYIIKNPKEVLNKKKGICYDIVELQRELFEEYNYEFKTFFSYEKLPIIDSPTHTYLVFKENDKYFWFESSWESYRGIHIALLNYKQVVQYVEKQFKRSSKWKSVNTIEYKKFNYKGMNINQFGEYIVKNFKNKDII